MEDTEIAEAVNCQLNSDFASSAPPDFELSIGGVLAFRSHGGAWPDRPAEG